LRNALITGEQSGFVEGFDPEEHLKMLHKKHNIECQTACIPSLVGNAKNSIKICKIN
jgi:hypothetical protein